MVWYVLVFSLSLQFWLCAWGYYPVPYFFWGLNTSIFLFFSNDIRAVWQGLLSFSFCLSAAAFHLWGGPRESWFAVGALHRDKTRQNGTGENKATKTTHKKREHINATTPRPPRRIKTYTKANAKETHRKIAMQHNTAQLSPIQLKYLSCPIFSRLV